MNIKTFVQGTDNSFFCTIGPLLTSMEVETFVGTPIHSETGDLWTVLEDGSGFALTHIAKNGIAHIKVLYARTSALRKTILYEVQDVLKKKQIAESYTFAKEDDRLWASLGYTMKRRKRSSFHRWEKMHVKPRV